MAHRAPRRAAGGLTLLEVVLTLTILALIGVLVLGAVRLGTRAWDRGEAEAEATQRLRVVYALLSDGLSSLRLEMTQETEGQTVAFLGGPDRLLFHTAAVGQGPLPTSAMGRGQAYFVESGIGLVLEEAYPLIAGSVTLSPRGHRTLLDPAVTRIAFRYLRAAAEGSASPEWVDAWDPREVPPTPLSPLGVPLTGASAQGLPLAVEVRLERGAGRADLAVEFVVPIRVGTLPALRAGG
jgi:general secretion pathway protein J